MPDENKDMKMEIKEITIIPPEGVVVGGDIHGESFQYVDLGSGALLDLDDERAQNDKSWTLGVKRSVICVNSGPAGPGGVVAACIDPPTSSDPQEEFLKLGVDDWVKKFEAVKKIPDNANLQEEDVYPAITGWRLEKDGRWKAPKKKGWKLRLADGESFAKMKVVEVLEDGKSIRICYGYQPGKDAKMEDDTEATLAPGDHFGFKDGASITPSDKNWDLKHGGDKLFLNSSVSGPGYAGCIGSPNYGFIWDNIKDAGDSVAYFMDEYGEIFRSPRWYHYNLEGDHQVYPNGAVYGVRTADGDYKVSVVSYDIFKKEEEEGTGSLKLVYAKL